MSFQQLLLQQLLPLSLSILVMLTIPHKEGNTVVPDLVIAVSSHAV